MTSAIAAYIDLPQRRTILAIQQIIMLAELAVNRVLDNHKIPQSPATAEKPLTLTLSQRERGLTEVFERATPTCNIESNSGFEKQTYRPPSPSGEGWCVPMRGKPNKPKAEHPLFTTQQDER